MRAMRREDGGFHATLEAPQLVMCSLICSLAADERTASSGDVTPALFPLPSQLDERSLAPDGGRMNGYALSISAHVTLPPNSCSLTGRPDFSQSFCLSPVQIANVT